MIKKIDFDIACFNERLEEKSVVTCDDYKRFDEMINNMIKVGISALDFSILTEGNVEQYKINNTDEHDCIQLIRRLSMLPSSKTIEQEDILF